MAKGSAEHRDASPAHAHGSPSHPHAYVFRLSRHRSTFAITLTHPLSGGTHSDFSIEVVIKEQGVEVSRQVLVC